MGVVDMVADSIRICAENNIDMVADDIHNCADNNFDMVAGNRPKDDDGPKYGTVHLDY